MSEQIWKDIVRREEVRSQYRACDVSQYELLPEGSFAKSQVDVPFPERLDASAVGGGQRRSRRFAPIFQGGGKYGDIRTCVGQVRSLTPIPDSERVSRLFAFD